MCHSLGFAVPRLLPFVIENKRAKKPQILFRGGKKLDFLVLYSPTLRLDLWLTSHILIVWKVF